MFKKTLVCFIIMLLLFGMIIPVTADTISCITDEAGLLLPEEIDFLEEKAAVLTDIYGIHAVVLTVDSLKGIRPQDYADDYYDQAGYGNDGVLLLLSMEERDWYISTSGSLVYALTDYGIQQLSGIFLPYFAEGLWYDGFYYFLDSLPSYLDAMEAGSPIDGYADNSDGYYHGDQEEIVYFEEEFTPSFPLSLLCGIVISGIVVFIMRQSMNSKRAQRCASGYMVDGSWKLTQHSDIFLYSKVTKSRKQESTKNSGGGSSVHRSSSGRSHGGGGGKF